ncbi:hypothetical protein [Bradyrhizobium sp. 170]|uniref:hypothetical protein n=1 Tax=Bradyrhizobium sp. 170 TaxID=2782641 RepID=UPI001FFFA428|nr:hypothetical protein [Bradyrhizobium sp. 170]UPK06687.1 hypothetical protein IVB05_14870 [Bradyrhizobium sp. 170]
MIIGRRGLLIATGCLLVSRQVRASDDQIALYWTVSPPGRQSAVLFGYDRVAAAVTPEIINDGISLVDGCQRVVLDMPGNIKFPTVDLDRDRIKPILQVVAPRTAERLRKLLAASAVASLADKLSGIEAMILLAGEGRHNADITAGGTIVDHARAKQKPIDQLLSEPDVQSAWQPPDLATLNGGIGDEGISYLLDLRDRFGPIGGYLEQLYRQRRAQEIERFTFDMKRHGVISSSQFHQSDRLRNLAFERAFDLMTKQADEQRFILFPLGVLTGASGILAALKAKGATVVPRA